jgi:hypothetical protein
MVLFLTNTSSVGLQFELATNMQVRAGGKWLAVDRHVLAGDLVGDLYAPPGEYRVAETLCSQREAEACRFHLRYRGSSPRWRAEDYLTERDLFRRAPRLFGWLTTRIPEHGRWHQTELEFELPKGPQRLPEGCLRKTFAALRLCVTLKPTSPGSTHNTVR